MTPKQTEILENAFATATELSGASLDAYLNDFRKEHPELATQLTNLLDADRESEGATGASFGQAITTVLDELQDPWMGREVGSWTIRQRIGSGGMGAVFLAEKTNTDFKQVAAIKIMSAQLLGEDAPRRFKSERQILASLNHPNIARLIDGGTEESGLPYIVMDYVKGTSLTRYLDEQQATIDERLRMFTKICHVVDFAHRNLVVHRDLKPSNILVDEQGEPKLLDFGIAKLLEPGDYDSATETQAGRHVMTPEYASPEQIRGETVSIATDIYALGVLLFRTLTGMSPYGASTTRQDIEGAILNSAPQKPSTAISQGSSTDTELTSDYSRKRAVSPQQLAGKLAGDLDNIVLKCLQKDPERRYRTALDLARDIDAYLGGFPVSAHGEHWLYTLRKFISRHRNAVTAAVASVMGIVALSSYYTHQLAEEKTKAETSARMAQRSASEAEEVSNFLLDLFEGASPFDQDGGREVSALDLLRNGEERITELEDQPIVQAKLLHAIGYSFLQLDQPEKGLEMISQSVNILQNHPEADLHTLSRSIFSLAEVQRRLEMFDASIENRRAAVELREQHYGPYHAETIQGFIRIGVSQYSAGRLREANETLDEALGRLEKADNPEEIKEGFVYTQSLVLKTVILGALGELKPAIEFGEIALERTRRDLGEDHPNTVISYSYLGKYHHDLLQLLKSESYWREAVERGENALGPAHHYQVSNYFNRAENLQALGRFQDAWSMLNTPVEAILEEHGETSLPYGRYLMAKCRWHLDQWQFEEAKANCRSADQIWQKMDRKNGADKGATLTLLGTIALYQDDIEVALAFFDDALATDPAMRPALLLRAQQGRGEALSMLGRTTEAGTALETVVAQLEELHGQDSASRCKALISLAANQRRQLNFDAALDLANRALKIQRAYLPADNWMIADTLIERGRIYQDLGNTNLSSSDFREASQLLTTVFGVNHPRAQSIR